MYGCESKVNSKVVLTGNDKLPAEVLQSKLSKEQSEELYYITTTLIAHLENNNVLYFPVFGSLLASYRNNIAILPWDDDLDFVVDNRGGDVLDKITSGLREFTDKSQCSEPCKMWYLTDDIIITFKTTGVPIKVSKINKYFPVVDVTTFGEDGEYIVTPKSELATGHIHTFRKRKDWIFPLQKRQTMFSFETKQPLRLYVPYNSNALLIDDYGADVMTTCITSHNHKLFCQKRNCEHVSANHLPKLVFPCSLLEGVL
jgi:hypothetical protein